MGLDPKQVVAGCVGSTRCRFLIGGTAAALLNWILRFPFNWIMPFWLAVATAGVVGIVFGFFLYRAWVFPRSRRPFLSQIRDFLIVNLISLGIVILASILLRKLQVDLGVQHDVAAAVGHAAGLATGAVANYIGHSEITFGQRR